MSVFNPETMVDANPVVGLRPYTETFSYRVQRADTEARAAELQLALLLEKVENKERSLSETLVDIVTACMRVKELKIRHSHFKELQKKIEKKDVPKFMWVNDVAEINSDNFGIRQRSDGELGCEVYFPNKRQFIPLERVLPEKVYDIIKLKLASIKNCKSFSNEQLALYLLCLEKTQEIGADNLDKCYDTQDHKKPPSCLVDLYQHLMRHEQLVYESPENMPVRTLLYLVLENLYDVPHEMRKLQPTSASDDFDDAMPAAFAACCQSNFAMYKELTSLFYDELPRKKTEETNLEFLQRAYWHTQAQVGRYTVGPAFSLAYQPNGRVGVLKFSNHLLRESVNFSAVSLSAETRQHKWNQAVQMRVESMVTHFMQHCQTGIAVPNFTLVADPDTPYSDSGFSEFDSSFVSLGDILFDNIKQDLPTLTKPEFHDFLKMLIFECQTLFSDEDMNYTGEEVKVILADMLQDRDKEIFKIFDQLLSDRQVSYRGKKIPLDTVFQTLGLFMLANDGDGLGNQLQNFGFHLDKDGEYQPMKIDLGYAMWFNEQGRTDHLDPNPVFGSRQLTLNMSHIFGLYATPEDRVLSLLPYALWDQETIMEHFMASLTHVNTQCGDQRAFLIEGTQFTKPEQELYDNLCARVTQMRVMLLQVLSEEPHLRDTVVPSGPYEGKTLETIQLTWLQNQFTIQPPPRISSVEIKEDYFKLQMQAQPEIIPVESYAIPQPNFLQRAWNKLSRAITSLWRIMSPKSEAKEIATEVAIEIPVFEDFSSKVGEDLMQPKAVDVAAALVPPNPQSESQAHVVQLDVDPAQKHLEQRPEFKVITDVEQREPFQVIADQTSEQGCGVEHTQQAAHRVIA